MPYLREMMEKNDAKIQGMSWQEFASQLKVDELLIVGRKDGKELACVYEPNHERCFQNIFALCMVLNGENINAATP